MGVDYLFLQCIRGSSLEDVESAIETNLAAEGWIPGVSAVDEDRPIRLIKSGPWIVVDDRHDFASTPWAKLMSEAVGGVGISLRVLDCEYALKRFDAGKLVGTIDNERAMKKALERRIAGAGNFEEDERALERSTHHRTAFLSDLASSAAKAKLNAGIRFAPSDSEDALAKIAKMTARTVDAL